MPSRRRSPNDRLRIELDTKHCELSAGEIAKVEKNLEPLHAHAAEFPVSDLYVTISYHERTQSYHVNLALVLPGQTLATARTAESVLAGIDACVDKLVRRILQYKSELAGGDDLNKYRKGTRHDVVPVQEPAAEQIRDALDAQDYIAFRRAMDPYEEGVRGRLGQWIERFPDLAGQLGQRWTLDDFVEETFLIAFERFREQPGWNQVRLGQRLESLIPEAVKAFANNPDGELSNIEFLRTALAAEEPVSRSTKRGQ